MPSNCGPRASASSLWLAEAPPAASRRARMLDQGSPRAVSIACTFAALVAMGRSLFGPAPTVDAERAPGGAPGALMRMRLSQDQSIFSSPISSQPSPSILREMIFGVEARCGRMASSPAAKWSLLTCGSAPSSVNASTRTYSFGFSRLFDHSKKRFPGSARVASVKARTASGNSSTLSGFTSYCTTMKIMMDSPQSVIGWARCQLSSRRTRFRLAPKPPGPSGSSEPLGDEDEEVAVGLEGVEFPGGELEVDEHSGGPDVLGEVVEVVAATGAETRHEATAVLEGRFDVAQRLSA